MDIKGAYLNAPIDKDIYVEQPPGYQQKSEEGALLTCKLKKSLYGLKQSGRNWYTILTNFFESNGFQPNPADTCTYTYGETADDKVIIIFWVDDIIIGSKDLKKITEIKAMLNETFKMDDRGDLTRFLGIEFKRKPDGAICMSQQRYINSILQRFNMENCKTARTPAQTGLQLPQSNVGDTFHGDNTFPYRQAIGCLIYLMTATRPDISWIVSKLSQHFENPGQSHITALKRVMRYLKGTQSAGLLFTKSEETNITGYSDSDWANDHNDRRSTTGYIFTFGSGPISWKTRKQQCVALSSCEAKYMALTEATKEALYLRSYYSQFTPNMEPTTIYCDNQSALSLTKDDTKHNRTKHIDVRYHFVKEQKDIVYTYIPTMDNLADYLTKPIGPDKHKTINQQLQIEGAC
jgi:hypothetical protein